MNARAAGGRAPGRPLDEQASDDIVDAAVALVGEEGFGGVTVDGVARRAGVSKATIYRRWPTKEALLLDAARCLTGDADALPDTGSLRGDLRALYAGLVPALHDGVAGRLLPELVAEGTRRPEIRALLAAFSDDRRRRWRAVVERAAARGELVDGVDVEVTVDCLTGPLFTRVLVTGRPLDDELVEAVLDVVLAGVVRRR
ncbi:MAG: TetR/AcrR family transcriptional regulator [Acidimicrobiales bacterium]|nr:TetR/AcrR family transcriptional regulator [Acidimicrobiales bacterium]MCB1013994.1 TetR/AcrR family transcriptional regulator [Acidimicrobiales bacterium]MCB9371410.1 TetR/AcrR family transcriptional regulator [Microthrixaceae bacterium]